MNLSLLVCHMRFNQGDNTLYHVLDWHGFKMCGIYACFNLQERGTLFVGHGADVYEGMVVGEHNRENDLMVNITREKHLTNVRASGSDENIILTPPRTFTLEQAIDLINDDEQVEITPKTIRLRKRLLSENDRKRGAR